MVEKVKKEEMEVLDKKVRMAISMNMLYKKNVHNFHQSEEDNIPGKIKIMSNAD